MEVVVASSSVDAGIGSWDLATGAELLRYKSCASPPHGLVCVGQRFLASSQLRDPSASSGSVLFWSWSKPQVEVKSFPAEPIKPLAANREGTYIVGGGLSGDIYLWEVWSLSKGKLLRSIVFPSIIDAITLDPGEHVFYAGSRDGKIYIAAINAESTSKNSYGLHIIKSLSNHSKAVTCLVYCASGNLLISGSEDGIVRLWDAKTHNIVRMFKHAKGPVNNILIVRQELCFNSRPISQASSRRRGSLLPPALEKYSNPMDEDADVKAIFDLHSTCWKSVNSSYLSSHVIDNQIKELQQQGSSAAAEMEMKRLKLDFSRSMQTVQQWKKMYENLHQFCVNELLDDDQVRISNGNST